MRNVLEFFHLFLEEWQPFGNLLIHRKIFSAGLHFEKTRKMIIEGIFLFPKNKLTELFYEFSILLGFIIKFCKRTESTREFTHISFCIGIEYHISDGKILEMKTKLNFEFLRKIWKIFPFFFCEFLFRTGTC